MFYFALARQFSLDDPDQVFKPVWLNGRSEPSSLLE